METASLRIKFTPLLNTALKNGSKCCLEIVPEVSCIQNLDKISWKQEKDLMEYTIPMTYKIILKKQDSPNKVANDLTIDELELDKTYHSCVDLLPTSSMTNMDFASGDVNKIISDTYILGKLSAQYNNYCKSLKDKPENTTKAHVIESQQYDSPKELPVLNNTDLEQVSSIVPDVFQEDSKSDNVITGHVINDAYEQSVVDKYSLDKITNTENAITVCKITETQSNDTSTDISSRSRDDSKRKLSLSPICSIDTNDNSYVENAEDIPLNLVVDRIFHYDTREYSEEVAFKLPTRNKKHVHIKTLNDNSENTEENSYKVYIRELPEERVAKFIKKMEIEIMPLKRMLNDIMEKCSKLDLSKNKYTAQNLVLYKTIPSYKNQVEKCCKTERQTKSNRVVYSVVFEG